MDSLRVLFEQWAKANAGATKLRLVTEDTLLAEGKLK